MRILRFNESIEKPKVYRPHEFVYFHSSYTTKNIKYGDLLSCESYYDETSKIEVYNDHAKIYFTRIIKSFLTITKEGMSINDEDCFLFGHYTKRSSKFFTDVAKSKRLYDIIKKYAPQFLPILINLDYLKSLGWEFTHSEYFKDSGNNVFTLYDNNIQEFNKNDKTLLFDFNNNEASIYDSDKKLIDKFQVIKNQDISKLKNAS